MHFWKEALKVLQGNNCAPVFRILWTSSKYLAWFQSLPSQGYKINRQSHNLSFMLFANCCQKRPCTLKFVCLQRVRFVVLCACNMADNTCVSLFRGENNSYVNVGCLFILGQLFSIALSPCIGICLVPGDVNGPFSSPWEPFLMSTYLHIRTAQREGVRERGRVRMAEPKEPERGRRNQTMPSPQGPSMMQLTLPFDTLTKEGQT